MYGGMRVKRGGWAGEVRTDGRKDGQADGGTSRRWGRGAGGGEGGSLLELKGWEVYKVDMQGWQCSYRDTRRRPRLQ